MKDDEKSGQTAMDFDGGTIEPALDAPRLGALLTAVRDLMHDGRWRTFAEIQSSIGMGSEGGISARLRDLRKERFGSHTVERRRRGVPSDGLFEYRLKPLPETAG
jgi:hypothetical protein